MATWLGIGTGFYGWRHGEAGLATATKWCSLFFFPICPIGRFKLKICTDFNEGGLSKSELLAALVLGPPIPAGRDFEDDLVELETLPLSRREILQTVLRAYVGFPLLLALPLLLVLGTLWVAFRVGGQHATWVLVLLGVLMTLYLAYVIAVPLMVVQRLRGFRGLWTR